MRAKWLSLLVLVLVLACGASGQAAELRVVHSPRPCILRGQFARIEARVEPVSDAVTALVLFRREGESAFYAVPMRREGERLVAVLPSPAADTTRIAYAIEAELGAVRARAPRASAYLADVVDSPCGEGTFATSATGPEELRVPQGAPQTPPGFERRGISAFLAAEPEAAVTATAARPAAPVGLLPIALGSRVRVRSGNGQVEEGRLTSLDAETLVVAGDGEPVRIPRERVTSLEVREKGSSGLRVLGGLVGAVAGVAVAGLICASSEVCESAGPLWIGLAGGAAAGAALTGGGGWKPVTLASTGPVALQLRRRGSGASAELRLGF